MDEHEASDAGAVLRWPTGQLGCFIPLLVGSVVLFGLASLDGRLADDLAHRRRGGIIGLTEGATIRGVNVPLVLVALYLCWILFRFAWRWADQIAVRATPRGLEPHRSTFMAPLSWDELADVSYGLVANGRWTSPALSIRLRDGSSKTIRGVAKDSAAADRFVAYSRAAIGRATASKGRSS